MKRLSLALVPVLALGLAACQRQAAPERTAQATPPPASTPAPPAVGVGARRPGRGPPPGGQPDRDRVATAPGRAAAAHPGTDRRGARRSRLPCRPPSPRRRPPARRRLRDRPVRSSCGEAVSTKTAKPEDPVVAELAEDVVVDGDVLLPAGSDVLGHVVSALRSGRVKGKARLVVSFSQVRTGGRTHRIDATGFDVTAGSSKGKDAKIAGGAAAAGVVIGAIADGGEGAVKGGLIGGAAGGAAVLATRGQEVELTAGSRYTIELRKSLRLRLIRASSRTSAHAACSRTTGSSSPASRSSAGRLSASPALPSATATLRSSPRRLARFTGLRRKRSRKASSPRSGELGEVRRHQPPAAARRPPPPRWRRFRFQGHTSWQMSQPKTWRPRPSRSVLRAGAAFARWSGS